MKARHTYELIQRKTLMREPRGLKMAKRSQAQKEGAGPCAKFGSFGAPDFHSS